MRFVPHFLSIVVLVCLNGLAPAQELRLELFLQTGHTALTKKTAGVADLIIGKHSVVGPDADGLNGTAVAALTGEEGGGAQTDVSERIEKLGNPLAQRYPDGSELHYAQNISDLKAFDGKLYVGHGDWVVDSGPTDIWYYDLQKKEFVKQGQIEDEAADHYRVINGRLYVPGTDPKEDWSLGNFYRLENEQWIKHRTLPGSIHCFDIVGVGDTLFATCTREIKQPPFLLVSSDDGKTWKIYDIPENRIARRLFVINENVYVPAGVAEAVPGGPESGDLKVYRFNGQGFDPCTGDILPGAESLSAIRIA